MNHRVGKCLGALLPALLCLATSADADVLVRWDQAEIPPRAVLGISRIVIPAGNRDAIERAARSGYEVYVEHSSEARLTRPALAGAETASDVAIDRRGKWPHVRANWVMRQKEIVQVAGRSAQPWLENNAALIRLARISNPASPPTLTYSWTPVTLAEADEGPALEEYLVAIAEAGTFGCDLVLPLHQRFQNDLLLGKPQARAAWNEISRYMDFYAQNLPRRYRTPANAGVITAEPMKWFELMNLLARHNVMFDVIDPATLPGRDLAAFKLLIVPEEPAGATKVAVPADSRFVRVTAAEMRDPNRLVLGLRRMLGRDNRFIDIWNGLTVIAAPYEEPGGRDVLVMAVNYAHQALPVQVRVRGAFSQVYYESPEQAATLLPYERRDGYTEFVIPALRVGGRVFLH